MAEFLVQGASLTAVADAIREKGGTSEPLSFPAGMAEAVRNIQSGGGAEWYEVIDTETAEAVNDLIISTDKNGRPISGYHALAMVLCFMIPADSTQTSAGGVVWVYPMATAAMASGLRILQTVAGWKTIPRTYNHLYAGSNRAIFISGAEQAATFDGSYTDIFNGVRLYVNAAGDHLPAGTKVRCLVLSKGWEA